MTYLIDTDWVASYLRGRAEAQTLLHALRPSGLAISLITYGEIYEGIYYGTNPAQDFTLVTENLRHFQRIAGLSLYQ